MDWVKVLQRAYDVVGQPLDYSKSYGDAILEIAPFFDLQFEDSTYIDDAIAQLEAALTKHE